MKVGLKKLKVMNNGILIIFRKIIWIILTKRILFICRKNPKKKIENFNDKDVYIIGAIVDHKRYKGITLKKAKEIGVRHARLPGDTNGRTIINFSQMFEILKASF
jgi:Trm5-related predicted tRNA methylase